MTHAVRSFEVQRADLRSSRVVDDELDLQPGDALVRIDEFALTTNNITYGVAGDMLGYWNFFPPSDGDENWGRIPAFGHGEIEASECDDVEVGQRFYGYWPMATHVVVRPSSVSAAGFGDTADHRQAMSAVYNRYSNTASDPLHDTGREAQRSLLFPLFMTAFVADDRYGEGAGDGEEYFGAEAIVISSASSKTAIGVAYLAAQRPQLDVVGLTSAANADFVGGLGCYDEVVTYDRIDELDRRPCVYSDMSGSGPVRAAVHGHFGDELRHSSAIGITHWEDGSASGALTGPQPEFFFAPAQITKRHDEWGPGVLDQRVASAWKDYSAWTDDWLDVRRHDGGADPFDEFAAVFSELVAGRADPRIGHVVSLIG